MVPCKPESRQPALFGQLAEELACHVLVPALIRRCNEVVVLRDELCYVHICQRNAPFINSPVRSVLRGKGSTGDIRELEHVVHGLDSRPSGY